MFMCIYLANIPLGYVVVRYSRKLQFNLVPVSYVYTQLDINTYTSELTHQCPHTYRYQHLLSCCYSAVEFSIFLICSSIYFQIRISI